MVSARHAQHLRWRRPPSNAASGPGSGRVYYLAPDRVSPSRGVRNIYRHVDELNTLGIEAAVVHTKPGFRCQWFANTTRTAAARDLRIGERDVLVIPEFYAAGLGELPDLPKKIIFNQGAYITFDFIPFTGTSAGAPYAGVPNLVALLTVSEDSEAVLAHAFPWIAVHRARPVVDGSVFFPDDQERRQRIGFTVSRRPDEREQLLHILRARGVLDGWELVPIAGRSEASTAETLRSCPFFLSFSDREGFGLPPAEAMASGCYVIGFTGLGGREYFDPECCSPVPENDVLAYARAVESAIGSFVADPATILKKGALASERVLSRYTSAALRDDLLAAYEPILWA